MGSTLNSIRSASALHGVQKDLDKARFDNIGDKTRTEIRKATGTLSERGDCEGVFEGEMMGSLVPLSWDCGQNTAPVPL